MIKLTTHCKDCIHCDVCQYKDNALNAMQKFKDTTYEKGPGYHYDWDIMMASKKVDVTFSCPLFSSKAAIRRDISVTD